MREWIALFESTEEMIPVDSLPRETKEDILALLLVNCPPFEKYWMEHHGVMSFVESYVSQFVFGDEDLDDVGGYDGDTFKVSKLVLNPQDIDNAKRSVSDMVVGKYTALTTKAPPILVRRVNNGWRIAEGGHRIAAAKARGDKSIEAYDVTVFYTADYESLDW